MRILAPLAAFVAALFFTACSSDDVNGTGTTGEPITIRLTLAASNGDEASNATRRMTRSWSYDSENAGIYDTENYDEGEGIYSWFVLMVNNETGKIEHVFTGSVDNKEEDEVNGGNDISTTTGSKTFYNFANLSQTQVATAAGLTDATSVFNNGAFVEGGIFTADQLTALNNATFAMNAIGYEPLNRTDGLKGIPMSGKQDYDLTWTDHYGQKLTLWVVRMLAKLDFTFTNVTKEDLTLLSVTLTPTTANATTTTDGVETTTKNIMLFPLHTDPSTGATQKPNLATSATTTTDPIYAPTGGLLLKASTDGTKTGATPVCKIIYVNEGSISDDKTYNYKEYYLTLKLRHADGTTTDQRYTLIEDNDAGEWTYIARNDRRVLPITLQEYKLTLTPYDYPPIGVLPSSVQEADGTFTCTFHAGGDFHLVPTVTSYATGAAVTVAYSAGAFENIDLADGSGALLTTTDAESGTTVPAWSTLYSTTPVWADSWTTGNTYGEIGALIHGTFQYGLTTSFTSRHRLSVTVTPTDNTTVARTLAAPVILKYVP